ncbi:MAG: hypothetical protein C4334_07885 [Pyrinomonas sp.]|uniref:hypothetical protein n=1 Tax=Pyrinomonas sp. TaxID=2080306 RepID=UPI00331845B7
MRYVLIDRIAELIPGELIRAWKNIAASDALATTRPSGHIVLPASMMLEAMAQAAGLLVIASAGFERQPVLAKACDATVQAEARPGARLSLTARLLQLDVSVGSIVQTEAIADDGTRAEATIYLALLPFAAEEQRRQARLRLARLFPEQFASRDDGSSAR